MKKKKENIDVEPRDKNGKPHGLHIRYCENGNLWYKVNFYHGKLNGSYKVYFGNGNLDYKRNYKMGKLYGLDITCKWDRSGEIKYKRFYL